ncbi:MAG TPA: hypothetical protein ENI06_11570 [Spirochaetales bacterium]|nr:hypothetical protein [Spirochaetales bacterium]
MKVKDKFSKKTVGRQEFILVGAFLLLISILLLSSRVTGRPPLIEAITPKIGVPGEVMVIKGKYFGESRNGGEVRIASYSPVSSSYLEWTDSTISLRIPEEVNSGLVMVVTRNGKSRRFLFTNRKQIPRLLSGPRKAGEPYIRALSLARGEIGNLQIVEGMNFGLNRGDSRVFFTWISGDELSAYRQEELATLVPAWDYDQDYEDWSDHEITVRVPDGASSGQLLVITDKGKSNALYFEVEGESGTKLFPGKRTYHLKYSVEIDNIVSEAENGLYLWLPQVIESPEQREIQLVAQEPEALFDQVNTTRLFLLSELESGRSYRVVQDIMFDRYSVVTKINTDNLSRSYDMSRRLYKKYTAPDMLVPSANERIIKLSRAIIGKIRTPYYQARAIYRWVLSRLSFIENPEERDVIKAIDSKEGDSYIYSMLFCALSRSAGIPTRPVAGYIVARNRKSSKHYWAECYIENIGWLPVDPLLGDQSKDQNFELPVDLAERVSPREYYFGNLDFAHIAFAKGLVNLKQMKVDGRAVYRPDVASLQNLHEEATGNLHSYSSNWSDIYIQGIY